MSMLVRPSSQAGVPVGILVAPIIPALTDHEMERIMEAAVEVGARWAGYVMLRLPYEVKDLFREWLAEHYPQRAAIARPNPIVSATDFQRREPRS